MERTWLRKPSLSPSESACPGDPVFLAPATNSSPPERDHPVPKHSQTLEVSRYRVVVEVAWHDRLEPSSGLGHGIMVTSGTEIRPNAVLQVNAGFSLFRWIVRSDKPLMAAI